MELKKELMVALKESMQQKDLIRKETVTMLRAAILQVEKDTQKELSDADMMIIVAKEVKKRRDSIPDYEKANREDIIERINKEIEVLSVYLPKQLEKEEIIEIVKAAIIKTGATGFKEMGKVMGEIKEKTAGKADGKLVSEIVRKLLENC